MQPEEFQKLMNSFNNHREAGRTPVQRNTFYEPIKILAETSQSATTVNETDPPSGKSKVLEDNLATA